MSDAHDPSPPRVRAVILDWAGTVIDHGSRAPVLAFVAGFAEQGVEITEAEARTPMGMSKRAHIEALCSMPSVIERWVAVHGEPPVPADIDRMYARFIPVLLALLPDHCAPIPGAFEAVQAMRARGLSIGSTTGYRADFERIFLTGEHIRRNSSRSSVLATHGGMSTYRSGHPHAKPVALLQTLMEWLPDGVIADPFAGSGSTLVAAARLGRKAIGVELEERYCEIAARRLSQGVLDFGEEPA